MRWWGWVIAILLVLWIVHHPDQASTDIHGVGAFLDSFTR